MDEILKTVKLEVAYDCESGSDLSKIWTYVEMAQQEVARRNNIDPASIKIDEAMKCYLWPYIRNLDNMLFKVGETVIYDTRDPTEGKDADFSHLTFEQAVEKYPSIYIRAHQSVIYKQLFGREEGLAKILKSENAYKIVQLLSRARGNGLSQARLSKILSIDPRSIFHYIKVIELEGLIIKCATFDAGVNTNMIILRKFAPPTPDQETMKLGKKNASNAQHATASGNANQNSSIHSQDDIRNRLRPRISKALENAKDGVMVEIDLMEVVGLNFYHKKHRKYFHRVLGFLEERGCLERILNYIPVTYTDQTYPSKDNKYVEANDSDNGNDAGGTKSKAKNKRKSKSRIIDNNVVLERRRCVRFIKPYLDNRKIRARIGVPLKHIKPKSSHGQPDSAATTDSSGKGKDADTVSNEAAAAAADSSGDNVDCDRDYVEDDNDMEIDSGEGDSSDDDVIDIEDIKEKEDIKHLLSMPQVQRGTLRHVPLETQIFRLVALSGSQGTVAKAIQLILHVANYKFIARALSRLEETPIALPDGKIPGFYTPPDETNIPATEKIITSVNEFMGREHRKRYFANPLAASLISMYSIDLLNPETNIKPLVVVKDASSINPDMPNQDGQHQQHQHDQTMQSVEVDADMPEAHDSHDHNTQFHTEDRPAEQSTSTVPTDLVPGSIGSLIKMSTSSSKSQTTTVNSLIRQEILMRMIEDEGIIDSTSINVTRLQDEVIKYLDTECKNSTIVTPSVIFSLKKHKFDRRTLLRSMVALNKKDKVWLRVISNTYHRSHRIPYKITLIIRKSIDPDGPMVDAYMESLRDREIINSRVGLSLSKPLNDNIPVERIEGAEERDRKYFEKSRQVISKRIKMARNQKRRIKNSMKRKITEYGKSMNKDGDGDGDEINDSDGPSRKRVRADDCLRIMRKANMLTLANPDWVNISLKMTNCHEKGVRIHLLYNFLVSSLPNAIDNKRVYDNYRFRSSYLFYELPLKLYITLCGGKWYIPSIRRYVRYGITKTTENESDSENESDEEETIEDVEGNIVKPVQSTLKEMEERLSMPVSKLPSELFSSLIKRANRTRIQLQGILYGMYLLQLIRPIHSEGEFTITSKLPDAADSFSDAPELFPHIMPNGYQLINRVKILNRQGYLKATAKTSRITPLSKDVPANDLTKNYATDVEYSMIDPVDRKNYWEDLQAKARDEAKGLPSSHPLFGIHQPINWKPRMAMFKEQRRILNRFVNRTQDETPLHNEDKLREISKYSGVDLEYVISYYRKIEIQWSHRRERQAVARRNFNKMRRARRREEQEADALSHGMTLEEYKSSRIVRQKWDEDDTTMVLITYVAMRFYSRRHLVPFQLRPLLKIFPNRKSKTRATEKVRQRWSFLMTNQHYKSIYNKMNMVWPYVFVDALKAGDLIDYEDRDEWDIKSEVYYFKNLLKEKSLDSLLSKYSVAIQESTNIAGIHDPIQGFMVDYMRERAYQRKKRAQPFNKSSNNPDVIFRRNMKSESISLPSSVDELMKNYIILPSKSISSPNNISGYEFPEDGFRNSSNLTKASLSSVRTMLTTRCAIKDLGDVHNPVTTIIKNCIDKSKMDVDDGQNNGSNVKVITTASWNELYSDFMDNNCPLRRELDMRNVLSNISASLNGGNVILADTAVRKTNQPTTQGNAESMNKENKDQNEGADSAVIDIENENAESSQVHAPGNTSADAGPPDDTAATSDDNENSSLNIIDSSDKLQAHDTENKVSVNTADTSYEKSSSEEKYAYMASAQALVLNLILTPEDEYNLGTVNKLLMQYPRHVTHHAVSNLRRHNLITKLKGYASSLGLIGSTPHVADPDGNESRAVNPSNASENPAAGPVGNLSDQPANALELEQTEQQAAETNKPDSSGVAPVVVYETSGARRVKAKETSIASQSVSASEERDGEQGTSKEATLGGVISSDQSKENGSGSGASVSGDGENANSAAERTSSANVQNEPAAEAEANPFEADARGTLASNPVQPAHAERMVPGRGYSISEKFLTALEGFKLPSGFVQTEGTKLESGKHVSLVVTPGDVALALTLFAQNKIVLRPYYDAHIDKKSFGALVGFRRSANSHVSDFKIMVHTADGQSVDSISRSVNIAPDTDASAGEVNGEHIETMSRIAVAVLASSGPLGLTVDEICNIVELAIKTMDDDIAIPAPMIGSRSNRKAAVQASVDRLVSEARVYAVGSTDKRYVIQEAYEKYWSVTHPRTQVVYGPYLGQSMSGGVNSVYMAKILRTISGQILENPGISQFHLMRKYFAPAIPKSEVLRYIDILRNHGVVSASTSNVFDCARSDADSGSAATERGGGGERAGNGYEITTYCLTLNYYQNLMHLLRHYSQAPPSSIVVCEAEQ